MEDPIVAKRLQTSPIDVNSLITEARNSREYLLNNFSSFTRDEQFLITQNFVLFDYGLILINSPPIEGIEFSPFDYGVSTICDFIQFVHQIQNRF
jgi:hypothetical protein